MTALGPCLNTGSAHNDTIQYYLGIIMRTLDLNFFCKFINIKMLLHNLPAPYSILFYAINFLYMLA